jgi:hypothetical protein
MVNRPVGILPLLLIRRGYPLLIDQPAHDPVKSLPGFARNACPASRKISAHDQMKSVPAITRNAQFGATILGWVADAPDLFLNEIAAWLAAEGIESSESGISRLLARHTNGH